MARLDVYKNVGPHAQDTPYLLDVQSDLLDNLGSRVVIPLRRLALYAGVKLPERLTPVIQIKREKLVLETPKMAAVPVSILKVPVASLAKDHDQITAALDFLFQGN
jgi:toxin CcdB